MTATRPLTLGTRGSPLALWQANAVATQIAARGGRSCQIVIVKTAGDRLADALLSEQGGKGLFVKELEEALLDGSIDLAVHSSKDMSATLPVGLTIAAALPREDPRDAFVLPTSARYPTDSLDVLRERLGAAPIVGTSSVRRIAQLRRPFPTARFAPIRGNLETRLRKLDDGGFSGLVLAAAGLRRLGFNDRIAMSLPAEVCVPAPGQGIVAVEVRADDHPTWRAVHPVNDDAAFHALTAERAVVAALGAGCQMPLGALATMHSSTGEAPRLELIAVVASSDGLRLVTGRSQGAASEAGAIGVRVAEQLMVGGAREILAAERRHEPGPRSV